MITKGMKLEIQAFCPCFIYSSCLQVCQEQADDAAVISGGGNLAKLLVV